MTNDEVNVASLEDRASTGPDREPRWRRILAALLVVVGCLLAPISVLGIWARNTLLETDGYVDTVAPLADDAAIQEAIATRVTKGLFERIDVEAEVVDALPEQADFVGPFVADGIERFVHELTLRFVESDEFGTLWERANRRAHDLVLAVLEGEGTETVETRNGQVVIDLGPLIDRVKGRVDDRGIDILNDVDVGAPRSFVLFESKGLRSAQSGVRLLRKLTFVFPVVSVLLLAGGIALSSNRRRTLLRAALGVAVAMALVLIAFNLARGVYLDAIEDSGGSRDAAAAAYDQVLDYLRIALRATMGVGVVVALSAWLAGPGRLATRIRGGVVGLVRGGGAEATAVGKFVHAHRVPLRVAVLALGLLLLVLPSHPGLLAVLVVGLLVVVGLVLIEFLGRTAHPVAE